MRYIFDVETDGLKATRLHCLSYCTEDGKKRDTLYDTKVIKEWLQQEDLVLIGHNIVKYDIPTLERLFDIKINAKLVDTLAISYYLEPERIKHGLESYGEEMGVKKPVVTDWESLTKEEYGWRCSQDVVINEKVWSKQASYLWKLYDKDREKLDNFLSYLTFKMDCLREQEEVGLKIDKQHIITTLDMLEKDKEERVAILTQAMPLIPNKTIRTAPKTMYKMDGTLSSRGNDWVELLKEKDLPAHTPEVEVITGYEVGNPNSHSQLKAWLYSLGWVPEHIKHVRDKKKNTVKKIPQIGSKQKDGEVCDSVKKLVDKEPALEQLDGLFIINHRIGIFKAFLDSEQDCKVYASALGLTNTLRMQHSLPVVNLPSVEKKYGKEVRASIIANNGCVLCGSDLSGIEDSTKRHYIWKYDPAYVEEMSTEGFDSHLDIAMLAGMLTQAQITAHKEGKENHKSVRQKAKVVNFSATYKIGAEALSRNSGLTLKEAKRVLKVYWERNKAILLIEKDLMVKEVYGQKWQQNPVNGWWYSLRAEKDRFSTLNQGTAVYVFDVWVMYMRQLGLRVAMQYHDEVLFNVKVGSEDKVKSMIDEAILLTNNRLQLNVKIGCSMDFGSNYSETH